MICERCGHDMADSASICPACGSATSTARASAQPSTAYGGPFPYKDVESPSTKQQYGTQQQLDEPPSAAQNFGYASSYTASARYASVYVNNASLPASASATRTSGKEHALIVEILLSLIGVFGVGWRMAGETSIGTVLLICSFAVFWPLMILGTVFTFGIGLLCLGPLAIILIIVNAIALNQRIMRQQRYPTTLQPRPPHYQ